MCISQIIERRFLVRGDKWLWHHLRRVIFPKILPRSKGHFSPAYAPSARAQKQKLAQGNISPLSAARAEREKRTHLFLSLQYSILMNFPSLPKTCYAR